ncbi:hypothetical protein OIU85_009425 [Salix viminalis]|uniref:Uncharacterized protein n=1 Tax=Salix viminalis TaxID=40686 RepID=A0A9Q0NUL4_SALVM|nr:hypothetical protein OIU85_009425 [Salix viminalis]
MFSLFYGLWKYMFSKTEFHVLILGIDKAGKTTLLEKLNGKFKTWCFWDLGGQPGLRTIWEKYFEEAHALIYVIDAACPSRFEDAKSALEKVLRHDDLQGAPLLILANKQMKLDRYLDLKKLDERVYMFEAVSAYDGMGIKESVKRLMEVMERSKRTEMLRACAGVTTGRGA